MNARLFQHSHHPLTLTSAWCDLCGGHSSDRATWRVNRTGDGGQKQRLTIASALISGKNFILLDEPTALLDRKSQLKVVKTIKTKSANDISYIWQGFSILGLSCFISYGIYFRLLPAFIPGFIELGLMILLTVLKYIFDRNKK